MANEHEYYVAESTKPGDETPWWLVVQDPQGILVPRVGT